MSKFFVWATAVTDAYADGLIARLARRRYHVGPLANDGAGMIQAGAGSALISLEVSKMFTPREIEALTAMIKPDTSAESEQEEDEDPDDEDEGDEEAEPEEEEKDEDDGLHEVVMFELRAALTEIGAKWHSLIVHDVDDGGFSWEPSNIEELPRAPVPPAMSSLLSDKDEFS